MTSFWAKVKGVDGSAIRLFSDLIVFGANLGIIAYIGGFNYLESYYYSFGVFPQSYFNSTNIILAFIKEVLLRDIWTIIITVLYLALFSIIYFSVRYVWRTWFGYLTICLFFGLSGLAIILYTSYVGSKDARNDWTKASNLPDLEIYLDTKEAYDEDLKNDAAAKALRLLYEDENSVYLLKPLENINQTSSNPVYVIQRNKIIHITVHPNPSK